MELDEMKAAWQELDRRVDANQLLYRDIKKEIRLDKTRATLGGFAGTPILELLSNILAAFLLGSFLADHFSVARFAVPALALYAVSVVLIIANARQITLLRRLDYAGPVLMIQQRLVELRTERLRLNQWIFLVSPLLWTPLAIVLARGLVGLDLYRAFGMLWVFSNLAFGLAVIPLALWIAKRYAAPLSQSRWFGRLVDEIAGRPLKEAIFSLDEIAHFEAVS